MRQSRSRPINPADVFINVPFDARAEPLYLAMIAGLVGLGLNPRCVVEVSRTRDRLRRLLDLIGSCAYSTVSTQSCDGFGG